MLHLLPLIPLLCVVSETEAHWVTETSVQVQSELQRTSDTEWVRERERERSIRQQRDGYNEVHVDERRGHSRKKRKGRTKESQFNKGKRSGKLERVEWKQLSCPLPLLDKWPNGHQVLLTATGLGRFNSWSIKGHKVRRLGAMEIEEWVSERKRKRERRRSNASYSAKHRVDVWWKDPTQD